MTEVKGNFPPSLGDIVFGLSVCLSVSLSVRTGRFLRHFVRLTPPRVFNAQKLISYESP